MPAKAELRPKVLLQSYSGEQCHVWLVNKFRAGYSIDGVFLVSKLFLVAGCKLLFIV